MRALLVHNPAAGGGRSARLLPGVPERLSAAGAEVQVHRSVSLADACAASRQAAGSVDAVIAMGGDGTVGACAAGLADAGAAAGAPGDRRARVAALGVIPAGGGNDAARNFGLPFTDPLATAAMLPSLGVRRADLVRAGDHFVLNAAGAGFDAEVSRRANQRLSAAPARLRYLAAVLAELVAARPCGFRLGLDGRVLETTAWLVAVANSQSYGGGMRIAPAARLDDGLLDVVVIGGELSKPGFLATFPKVFSGRLWSTRPCTSTGPCGWSWRRIGQSPSTSTASPPACCPPASRWPPPRSPRWPPATRPPSVRPLLAPELAADPGDRVVG
jgi:diacylglycerol kinase (ATP)